MKYFVRGIAFHVDGVTFDYATEDGLRPNGLVLNQSLFVPADDVFADPLDDFIAVMHRTLDIALAEFDKADPVPMPVDDDEPSPYDNPLERPGVTS